MSNAHAKAWIKNLNAQGQSRLTRDQRRSNKRWVETQPPDRSTLLQIGANTHSATGFRSAGGIAYDVGPDAVAKGWRSVLVEPMPTPFAALSKRYQSTPHVKLVNGAVCDNCTLSSPGMDMLYVDVSNATGNWGSRRADGRCLAHHPAEHMFTEIASLSKSHLLRHEPYFRTSEGVPKCTQKLNLTANPLPRIASARSSTEHTIDTRQMRLPECFDQRISYSQTHPSYPAHCRCRGPRRKHPRAVPVWFCQGRSYHIRGATFKNAVFRNTAEMLQRFGFELVFGGFKAPLSTWHHVNATS